MPTVKSAAKQARASQRKRIHNNAIKSRIRSGLREFTRLSKENPAGARTQGRQVISWLDRAAKTKVVHKNLARRFKSRLVAQIGALAK